MVYFYDFLASGLEVFSMCCVLGILREQYWDMRKILGMAVSLAAITTGLDAVEIEANVGINIVMVILLIKLLYRTSFIEALFDTVWSSMIIVTVELITTYLLLYVSPLLFQSGRNRVVYLLLLAFCFLIVFKCMPKKSVVRRYYLKYQAGIWIISLNFLLIQLAQLYNWNETKTVDISIVVLVFITMASNLILAFKLMKNQQQAEELKNQKLLMELKEGFLQQMAAEQHEFSKHLKTLQVILDGDESAQQVQAAKGYIEQLISRDDAYRGTVYAGDGILSAVLHSKRKEAEQKGILLSMLVSETVEFPCAQTEIVELVGNLLDNAFEAVELMNDEQRKVFFEIGRRERFVFIQTINSLSERFLGTGQMAELGASTKKGHLRGYGLFNVKTIAERYGGKLEIRQNEDIIMVKIYFINSSGQSGSP